MTKLAFGDLAAKLLAPEPVARSAAPNLDSSMRFAPDDPTDHLKRIADARGLEVARAAAVVAARRAIEAANQPPQIRQQPSKKPTTSEGAPDPKDAQDPEA